MLAGLDFAAFPVLRDELGVSDSVLSKHLADAGGGRVREADQGDLRGSAAHVGVTHRDGRKAYAAHVAALRSIVGAATPGLA